MSEATKIYLHIGMHKTGTTSIQAALARGGDFHYPDTGRKLVAGQPSPGHHLLAASAIPGADPTVAAPSKSLWDDLLVTGKTIISSETFCKAGIDDIARVREYLGHHDVSVVLYLRNHLAFSVSSYKQVVKQGTYDGSFRKHVERIFIRLDYDAMIRGWQKHFEIDVRFFDKVKADLLSDFASAVEVSRLGSSHRRNVTPPEKTLITVKRLNKVFPKSMHRAKANVLGGRVPGRYLTPFLGIGQMVTDSDRAWFASRTEDVRKRFIENHVAPEDAHYFDV